MGVNRDLKKATEAYWAGKLSQKELLEEGKRLRLEHWKIQKNAGIDVIPSNDFSYYDHVLDHIQFFGVRISPPPLPWRDVNSSCSAYQTNTLSTTSTQSTNSSPWAEDYRSLRLIKNLPWMFPVWYVAVKHSLKHSFAHL